MSRLSVLPCDLEYPHLGHDWRGPESWVRCVGIRIPEASRAQRPSVRRHVVAELRSVIDMLRLKVSRWNVTGVEWDGDRMVPRRVDDFPENRPEAWTSLARLCRDLQADLGVMAEYADKRAGETFAYTKRRDAAVVRRITAQRRPQ